MLSVNNLAGFGAGGAKGEVLFAEDPFGASATCFGSCTATARLNFNTDGEVTKYSSTTGTTTHEGSWWTQWPQSGAGDDYEIMWTQTGGSTAGLTYNPGWTDGTWYALTAQRYLSLSSNSGSKSFLFDISIRDATTLTVLDTASCSLFATQET